MKTLFLTSSVHSVMHHIPLAKGLKAAFILTAAEGEPGDLTWLNDDRDSLGKAGLDVYDYTLTGKNAEEVRKDLQDSDVLFFSGGNTFYLCEKIQQSNSAGVIREFIESGKIYIGSSAGSLIAGPDVWIAHKVDALAAAPNLKTYEGLSLVDFTVLPHWGSEDFKDLYMNHRLEHAYNEDNKLILLNDKQYVHVKDDWYRIEEAK